jgi:hypothetical protein
MVGDLNKKLVRQEYIPVYKYEISSAMSVKYVRQEYSLVDMTN